MSLVNYIIPNFINGISQQADALRRETQGELMDNGWASVVEGLQKRPPIEHVAKLTTDTDLSSSFVHAINRDTSERYIAIFGSSDIKVFGVDGVQYTVDTPAGLTYMPTDPSTQLRVVTVDDYSFVLNTQTSMAMSGVTPSTGNEVGFVEVRAAAYTLDYTIEVKDADGTYSVTLTTGSDVPYNNTDQIAEDLASTTTLPTGMDTDPVRADGGGGADGLQDLLNADATDTYVVTVDGNVIKIENTSGNPFTIDVTDGAADSHIQVAKAEVEAFTDLPTRCEDGFTVQVVADAATGSSAYWVAFERPSGSSGIGVGKWVETVDPSIDSTIDASTMPHVLVRRFDDGAGTITGTANAAYFSFEEFTWDDRAAGDTLTNPEPSFIGTTARDIFFWRDRLGILTPGEVVLSEAGYYGNFFRTTVTTLNDSAPIDLSISDNQVSNMLWAVPDEQELILFSDQTQYVLSSPDLLTPSSASIRATTRFEADRDVRPILLGDRVYFPQQNGGYVGVREYYINADTQKRQADEITIHVNRYIEGDVKDITGSAQSRAILVATTGSRYVYVYQWFTSGNTKLQSAWHRWDLGVGDTLLGYRFIDTTLYFVSQRSDGVYLEKIETDPGRQDDSSGIVYHLDRRVEVSDLVRVYDDVANTTTITLPYPCDEGPAVVVPGDIGDTSSYGDPDFSGTYYHIERCTDGVEPPVYVQGDEFSVDDVFILNGICYKVNSTTEADPPLTSVLRVANVTSSADCPTCVGSETTTVMAPPLGGTSFLRMARCDDDSMGEYSITEQIMGFPAGDDLTKIYKYNGVCYYVTNNRENTPSDPLFPVHQATIFNDCPTCTAPPCVASATTCTHCSASDTPETLTATFDSVSLCVGCVDGVGGYANNVTWASGDVLNAEHELTQTGACQWQKTITNAVSVDSGPLGGPCSTSYTEDLEITLTKVNATTFRLTAGTVVAGSVSLLMFYDDVTVTANECELAAELFTNDQTSGGSYDCGDLDPFGSGWVTATGGTATVGC